MVGVKREPETEPVKRRENLFPFPLLHVEDSHMYTVHSCISIGWKTNEKRSGKKCCWWNLQVSISYFQHLFRFWTWIILKIFDIFLKITKQNLTWHSQTGGVDTPVYYKKNLSDETAHLCRQFYNTSVYISGSCVSHLFGATNITVLSCKENISLNF